MKKILMSLVLLFGLAGYVGATEADLIPDRNVLLRYQATFNSDIAASTNVLVIDLSGTSSFPHTETKAINISAINITIDKVAAATATVKVGVVTFVDSSTGSVTWFHVYSSSHNVSNTAMGQFVDFQPSYIRTRVNHTSAVGVSRLPGGRDGTTPFILSNDKETGSVGFQNDVDLANPTGTTIAPAEGDIVMRLLKSSAHRIIVGIEILYHAISR